MFPDIFLSTVQSPEKLLDNDPSFFNRFNLVVATQLPER